MFSALRSLVASHRKPTIAGRLRAVPIAYTAVLCWCEQCERRQPQTVTGRCSVCLDDKIVTLGNTYHHEPKPLDGLADVVAFSPRRDAPLPASVDSSSSSPLPTEAGLLHEAEIPEPTADEVARELSHLEARNRCRAAAGLDAEAVALERAR